MGRRTILALGGGGFTSTPGDPALDELVLELAGAREPKILFLPTASGDAADQVARFMTTYGNRACVSTVLSLFRLRDQRSPLDELILAQDVIYVGGGSMRNLIALWREHGIDDLLRAAWEQGTVLAGLSAGAMCWFEWGITRSAGAPAVAPGLGFIPGAYSVHRDSEPERRPVMIDAVRTGAVPGGWMADDAAGLVFEDDRLVRVVAARPDAGVSRVEFEGHDVVERHLQPEQLAALRTLPEDDPDVRELRAVRSMRGGSRLR